jgi:hypothetical protein
VEAYWFHHQVQLLTGNVDGALKDLTAITDMDKSHLGSLWTQARIFQYMGIMNSDSYQKDSAKWPLSNFLRSLSSKPDIPKDFFGEQNYLNKKMYVFYSLTAN